MQVRRFLFPAVAGAFALCVGASQASIPASPVATSYDAREAAPAATPVPAPPQLAPPATVDTATRAVPAPAAPASAAEVPATALAAYHRAESVINSASPHCHLPWELLAAVGQVESDHGRSPHAAGPVGLTSEEWRSVAVDADGDGDRDRRDLDDAALGLAVLLCADDNDLSSPTEVRAALARHNSHADYLDAVLALAADLAVPPTLTGPTPTAVGPTPTAPSAPLPVAPPVVISPPTGPSTPTDPAPSAPEPLPASAGTNFPHGTVTPPAAPEAPAPHGPTDPEPTDPEPTDPEPTDPQPGEPLPTDPSSPDGPSTPTPSPSPPPSDQPAPGCREQIPSSDDESPAPSTLAVPPPAATSLTPTVMSSPSPAAAGNPAGRAADGEQPEPEGCPVDPAPTEPFDAFLHR